MIPLFFVECNFRNEKFHNPPVNLVWCKSLRRSESGTYPSIVFQGCDESWTFESKKERDIAYEKILSDVRGLVYAAK